MPHSDAIAFGSLRIFRSVVYGIFVREFMDVSFGMIGALCGFYYTEKNDTLQTARTKQ